MSIWLELEWRPTPDTDDDTESEWTREPTRPFDGAVRNILGLQVGSKYDVRARTYDDDTGKRSGWDTRGGVTVLRPQRDPPAPTEVRQTSAGCLSWRLPEASRTIVGYRIRYAGPHHQTWSTMEPAHEGTISASPWPLCELPGGQRTVGIVSVDRWGNESSTPALAQIHVRELDDTQTHVIRTIADEDTGFGDADLFGGAWGGSSVVAGATVDADLTPFWPEDLAPFWSIDQGTRLWTGDDAAIWGAPGGRGMPFWSGDDTQALWSTRYRWIEYVRTMIADSCEAGTTTRFTWAPTFTSPNRTPIILYRRPAGGAGPTMPAEFWSEDGEELIWSVTATDGFWNADDSEPWREWPGRIDGIEPGPYRVRLLIPGGVEQGSILTSALRLSVPERVETTEAVAIPLNGTRVPPSSPFRRIIEVRTQHYDTSPVGTRVEIVDKDRTNGPHIKGTDITTGSPASAIVDVTLRGY